MKENAIDFQLLKLGFKVLWHRQRWAIFLATYASALLILSSLQRCCFSPANTSNCTALGVFGFLRNFSFSQKCFVYTFKPSPSHEHRSLFSLLHPVVIRGFCFYTDLENFLPGIQILSSDVRMRDNGPLPALGWGSDRETRGALVSPARPGWRSPCVRAAQCVPTGLHCSLPRHRGLNMQG